jgi:EmrB/QacA subfamily drug resistance transporter
MTSEHASDHPAPEHRHLGLALALISAAQLMIMIDTTIVNVALPSIQHELHFTLTNIEWVITGYVTAFGSLLLLGGRSGDLYGQRRMFVAGIVLFTLASLAGGLASDQAWLVAARIVQGVGAAVASPTALALVVTTFPDGPPRHRAMAVYAAMGAAGGALGLLLGGVLTEFTSWRWIFLVNVPVGIAVAAGARLVLGEAPRRRVPIDLGGTLTASAGMGLLVYGISRAATHGWGDNSTVATLVASGVVLLAFVAIERRSRMPLLPFRILANRDRAGVYGITFFVGAAMLANLFFVSQFLQDILGYSPLQNGLAFLPIPFLVATTSQVVGRVMRRTGPRPMLTAGPLFVAGGLAWMSRVSVGSHYASVLGPLVLVGLGVGLSIVPLTVSAVTGVRRDESGLASALLNTAQQVGGSLGLSLFATIAASTASYALAHDPRHGLSARAAMLQATAHGFDWALRSGAIAALSAVVVAVLAIRAKASPRPAVATATTAGQSLVSRETEGKLEAQWERSTTSRSLPT